MIIYFKYIKFTVAKKAKLGLERGTPEQVKNWNGIETGINHNFIHLNHFQFEQFIAELFNKMGYKTSITKKTGDYGIDIVATKDKEEILAIQVKQNREGNNIGAVTVQNVLGSMWKYKANKAVIITTSDFTIQAKEQAKEAPVELWNKRILHELARKYFIDNEKSAN